MSLSRISMDRRWLSRGIAFLLLVGACLVFWLASSSDPRVGPSQNDRSWVAGYLTDHHSFGQIMRLPLERLIGIRVWLCKPVTPNSGVIVLQLRKLEDKRVLATSELPVSGLTTCGPITFRLSPITFDPVTDGEQVAVMLTLETHDVSLTNRVSVIAGQNQYGNGLLLRDNQQIPLADLSFTTLYASSRFDHIVPITDIAQSKPGIFGWAPLYALLMYGLLIALAFVFHALVRARSLNPAR